MPLTVLLGMAVAGSAVPAQTHEVDPATGIETWLLTTAAGAGVSPRFVACMRGSV